MHNIWALFMNCILYHSFPDARFHLLCEKNFELSKICICSKTFFQKLILLHSHTGFGKLSIELSKEEDSGS